MAKSLGLEEYWSEFVQSPEFVSISSYPIELIRKIVFQLDTLMKQNQSADTRDWDGKIVLAILNSIVEQDDDSPEIDNAILTFYDVLRTFFRFLAINGALGMSESQLNNFLDQFEYEKDLESIRQSITPEEVYYIPGLPQWRQYTSNDINRYTAIWVRKYSNSSVWKSRSNGVTKKLLSRVMNELTNNMYNNYRKTPKTWTKKGLEGVMTHAFVEEMDFTEKEYRLIAPAVSDLMNYVAGKGWLNETRAENYQRYLTAIAPKMIELSKNPLNYSPSKLLKFKMKEHGVDPENGAAVEKFLTEVDDNGGLDSLLGKETENDQINHDIETALKLPEALELVAQLYDPDRDQNYLNSSHKSRYGIRTWSKKNAILVHTQAVQDAILLWGHRDEYDIKMFGRAEVLIQNVVDFMDIIYSQNVETPKQWSIQTFSMIGQWTRDENTPGFYANMIRMLTGLLEVISDEGSFSEKHAAALLKAYRGNMGRNNVVPFRRK